MSQNPFWHYNALFDPVALVRKYAAGEQAPRPGFYTSYFGVAIDPRFFPDILGDWTGLVEEETVPANWHSDLAEFGAALRAVDLAGDRFTMLELGCGWGCWMALTGAAARRRGLEVTLMGVEADPQHIAFARQAMADNGFADDDIVLHRGIAAGRQGEALFPTQDEGGGHWGLSPIFDADGDTRIRALLSGKYEALPLVALNDAIAGVDRLDLLHVDIQGGEADLVADTLDLMDAKVAYTVIGTHGRDLEGRLFQALGKAGWVLEIERPAMMRDDRGTLAVHVDGVQGWRNPRLLPV